MAVILPEWHSALSIYRSSKTLATGAVATLSTLPLLADAPTFESVGFSATNSTLPVAHTITETGSVPWQSVWWALAAIAISTCLQHSGQVCGMPERFSPLLRSSPLFCLLDSATITYQVIYYWHLNGPRRAFQIISISRRQHVNADDEGYAFPVATIIRGIVATLAILQAVKLFAMNGIIWTQLCGACYLISYIVNAAINLLGKPPSALGNNAHDQLRRGDLRPSVATLALMAFVAEAGQVLLWTIMMEPLLPPAYKFQSFDTFNLCTWPIHGFSIILWVVVYFLTSFCILVPVGVDLLLTLTPALLVTFVLTVQPLVTLPTLQATISSLLALPDDVVLTIFRIIAIVTAFTLRICKVPLGIGLNVFGPRLFEAWEFMLFGGFIKLFDTYMVTLFFICSIALVTHLLVRLALFGVLAERLGLDRFALRSNYDWWCFFFFAGNIGFGLLFYSRVFDSQHVSAPGWLARLPRTM